MVVGLTRILLSLCPGKRVVWCLRLHFLHVKEDAEEEKHGPWALKKRVNLGRRKTSVGQTQHFCKEQLAESLVEVEDSRATAREN